MTMTTLPEDAVLDAVNARLRSDTDPDGVYTLVGGRIYRDVADSQTPVYPFVTISPMTADDLLTVNGEFVWTDVQILTKVWDTGNSYARALTIAARIRERLQSYERVTVNGVYITKFRRVSAPPQPSDYVNGKRYIYSNQLWMTEAEPA